MSSNERIIEVRKAVGLNQIRFGERINISSSGMSKLEKGDNNPSAQTISLICREFGISRTWLETGEGDMMDTSVEQDIELLTRAMEGGSSAKKQLIRIVAAMPDDLLESMVSYLKSAIKEPEA